MMWDQTSFPLFLGILFFIGLISGALYAQKNTGGYLKYFVAGYLEEHLKGTFTPVFSLSFLPVIALHVLIVMLAFSCLAFPFIASLPFLKGFSMGMIVTILYVDHGLKGILIDGLLLWIPGVIQSIALLLFCCEALGCSLELFRGVLLHKGTLSISIGDFLGSFVLWSAIGLAAAMLEGVLSMLFGPIF